MATLFLIIGGLIGILSGRLMLKRWFNHLSVYSTMWSISLGLYSLQLIQYNSIIPEAWFYILLAWFVLYLGSATILLVKAATCRVSCFSYHNLDKVKNDSKKELFVNTKILARVIIILLILASLSTIYQWFYWICFFGGIKAMISNANQLYQLRVEGVQAGLPYLGAFALAACSLAGAYTAVQNRFTIIGTLPLILVGLQEIGNMGRAYIVMGAILFLTTFIYASHEKILKGKAIISLILMMAISIGIFTFICSTRGLVVRFAHETAIMETLRSWISFLPSLYFYLSGPPVVFSEYLKSGGEDVIPGTYTLRPLFNVLSKLGLVDPLPRYTASYLTPEPMNAATYLRALHADFGPIGIIIIPYVLGIVLTVLHLQISQRPTLTRVVLFSHLFVIIFLSWDVCPLHLGYWWVSILAAAFVSLIITQFSISKPQANQRDLKPHGISLKSSIQEGTLFW